MGVVAIWIIGGIITAIVAHSKGRKWARWFLYGCLIWPVALTHAIVIRRE